MINKKEFEMFKAIVNKPVLFSINKVEDYYVFILGYSLANPEKNIHSFINSEFTKFIKNTINSIDGEWYQIIRYQATNDSQSVQLFKQYFNEFLDSLNIG